LTEPVRQLGRYELLKRIAKGGMGEIWLARARGAAGFEKTCIIKKILGHLAEEEEFVTKFLDEGRIVVQLVHGNIVPVFDMGEENGEYYLAMEYIPGRDLREVTKRLRNQGDNVPVDLALFVTSEVCKGLDYAHRKTDERGESLGIVHRDVSPSNVLISREGEVKLIDFGIARAAGRQGKTVTGRIQGKFCYMSPEQASGKKLDGRSDVFSTGVVLYEMLTSFRPFEGDTDLESLDLVRRCEFDPPSTLNPEVPPEVDAIIAKALGKDPATRHQTIDQLQLECLQYLYTAGTAPTPSELAEFLSDVFPEGLEREELRSARDSAPSPPKKMNLDEALDFELGRLIEGSDPDESIDPLETTAVSSDPLKGALGPGPTRTRAAPAESSDGSESAPGTTAPTEPDRPEPAGSAATAPAHSEADEGRSRGLLVALLLIVLVGGGLAVYGATRPERGSALIRSEPAGAQILVDGAHEGARTPNTLKLPPGEYEITLELDGHEPRTMPINVRLDQRTELIARLDPVVEADSPRNITVSTQPADAIISMDGARLGVGEAVVTLQPGTDKTFLVAREGCDSMRHTVSYATKKDHLDVELTCRETAPDAGEPPREAPTPVIDPESTEAKRVKITVKSDPPGATIWADGKRLGEAPVTWVGRASETVRFKADEKGYQPVSIKRRARTVRGNALTLKLEPAATGCLNARVMYPFVARWAVDGKWLPGDKEKLAGIELSAGKHTVRVKNDVKGGEIDHTFTVDIEPGDKCAVHVVDGRKL
jgi:serine/threonine protein kinase